MENDGIIRILDFYENMDNEKYPYFTVGAISVMKDFSVYMDTCKIFANVFERYDEFTNSLTILKKFILKYNYHIKKFTKTIVTRMLTNIVTDSIFSFVYLVCSKIPPDDIKNSYPTGLISYLSNANITYVHMVSICMHNFIFIRNELNNWLPDELILYSQIEPNDLTSLDKQDILGYLRTKKKCYGNIFINCLSEMAEDMNYLDSENQELLRLYKILKSGWLYLMMLYV